LSQPRASLGNGVAISIPTIPTIPAIPAILTIPAIVANVTFLANVAGVADVYLERQRRSLLKPKAGDNVACLGYFIFGYTTPTGLPILSVFHNASFSDKIVVRLIGEIMRTFTRYEILVHQYINYVTDVT
jgi:hypothetical protein